MSGALQWVPGKSGGGLDLGADDTTAFEPTTERFFAALIDRKRPIRRPYVSERPRELGVQPKTLATLRQVQYPIRQREA